MNIPNFLTLCRVLLIPILLIFLINGQFGSALAVFMLASLTDALDGFIAKVFHQETLFGAYFDPVADKLLIDSAYVALSIIALLPGWFTVIVLSRDVVIVLGIVIFLVMDRPLTIQPIWPSKVTTFLQMVTVCLFFEYPIFTKVLFLRTPLVVITSFFTLFSGFYYIVIGFMILNHNGDNNGVGGEEGSCQSAIGEKRK